MQDMDKVIEEAISREERDLLRRIGEEPGFFPQMFDIFRGRTGWVNVILMVVQTVFFIAGVWAGWQFFAASDVVSQLRWGLPATVLLIMGLLLKMMIWPSFETNRILRELKRIELKLALMSERDRA